MPKCSCACGCRRQPNRNILCLECGKRVGPGCCLGYETYLCSGKGICRPCYNWYQTYYWSWCKPVWIWHCENQKGPPTWPKKVTTTCPALRTGMGRRMNIVEQDSNMIAMMSSSSRTCSWKRRSRWRRSTIWRSKNFPSENRPLEKRWLKPASRCIRLRWRD